MQTSPQENGKPKHSNSETSNANYISYPLDSGIIVMFPNKMFKKLVTGAFLAKLNELEELGKEGNGDARNNASDTPVESN